jgi:hypothetical protein
MSSVYRLNSGKWLKMHFEGDMKAFQEQYEKFHKEWYQGTDILRMLLTMVQSPYFLQQQNLGDSALVTLPTPMGAS